jgi:hypothetical protein
MKTLSHFLIITLIMLTACTYALKPALGLSEFWASAHSPSLHAVQATLQQHFTPEFLDFLNNSLFTLPLWQGLIGLTLLIFLFSRLSRS